MAYKKPTPEEQTISDALDVLYPKAQSKTIVEYKGKHYQLKYFPVEKDDDGEKVKAWGHRWAGISNGGNNLKK